MKPVEQVSGSTMNQIKIQFLRPWSIYTAGDVAAFDETRAQAFIDWGIAQRCPPFVRSTAPVGPKDQASTKEGAPSIDLKIPSTPHSSETR